VVSQLAQRTRVAYYQSRAFRLQDLTLLHIRKQPGNRLARRADPLGDLFMGER